MSHYNITWHLIKSRYNQYKHQDKLKRYYLIKCWYTII